MNTLDDAPIGVIRTPALPSVNATDNPFLVRPMRADGTLWGEPTPKSVLA